MVRKVGITNEEKAEISSFFYQNDESDSYAVVPYSSGLPHLSLNKEVEIEKFRNTGKTVHSHGPEVSWNRRLEKETLKFINKYASSRQEREALMNIYYRPFADKKGNVQIGGDRRQPSRQDNENSSGWLITDENKIVPFNSSNK